MDTNIHIERIESSRIDSIDFDNLKFGKTFSDHMFVADYTDGKWQNYRIEPFQNISISPANMTLHYSQTVFEGMKATITEDGTPLLFRPEMNAKRLNASAIRMSMPPFPVDEFLEALETLVVIDKEWIPKQPGHSLYIRPFMFATDEYVGVKSSDTYKLFIITTPVSTYYSKSVSLLASEKYVRATHGGVGEAKTGGNYAATLLPVKEANKEGYDQILWLDGKDFTNIQECGTMNLFFIIDGKVVTPIADGAILNGITRDSIITYLRDKGLEVDIRLVTIKEIFEAADKGLLEDAFGTGTAAVITHIDSITWRDKKTTLPPLENRPHSVGAKEYITLLRSGEVEDKFGWIRVVNEEDTH